MQNNKMNTLKFKDISELKKVYLNTNNNIKILEIIIKSNLFLNIFILNQMKNTVALF